MTERDDMMESVASYALGSLPGREGADVRKHLRTCEGCAQEYRDLRPAVSALAYSAQACATGEDGPKVSPLLKARIMSAVRRSPSRAASVSRVVAAACLVAVVVAALVSVAIRYREQPASTSAARYAFAGGVVTVSGDRISIKQHLRALPSGRVYQVWTLARGARAVAPSVTFSPGQSVVRVPRAASQVVAVAISIEPAGGSLHPSTKPVALVRILR
ncbi:MAG: anti-sigma factor domain-containing protein [Candidatus Tyrphobacter sp.]